MPDEFGGIEIAEKSETDEFGGVIAHPPTDQKWEKPLPLGQRLIDNYARPVLQGLGSATGIIVGGTAGTAGGPAAPATVPAGAIAGSGLGYAIGDEIADLLQEWLGYYEPLPIMMNLQEAGENVLEGTAYEAGGYALGPAAKLAGKGISKIPGVGRMGKWVGSLFPKTDKRAQKAAGEVLSAFTNKGPIVAKNIEEARAIEELIGGNFKFDLGQLTGDVNVVKFMREGINDAGDLAVAQAEQAAINTRAINDFIKKSKGKGTTKDFIKPLSSKEDLIADAEAIAKSNLEKQQAVKTSQVGSMDIGGTIRSEMEAGETAARKKASEMFDKVPNQKQIVDDLYDEFNKIMKPMHADEQPDKFPRILKSAIKTIEDSLKKSGKDEPTKSLRDIQGLRSEILEDLRTAKEKGMPRSLRARLAKAVEVIDQKLSGGGKVKPDELIYHHSKEKFMSGKPDKGSEGYFFGDEGFEKDYGAQWGDELYAVKIPKNAKILDLRPRTDEKSLDFMIATAKKQGVGVPTPPTKEAIKKNPELLEDFLIDFTWTDKEILTETLEEFGYHGAKWEEEFFIPKKLLTRSQAYNPKTLMPISKNIPAQELQAAQKFFREEVIEKYGKGSTGAVLRGEESVQSAIVAGKFFRPGPAGEQAAEEFMKVMGDNPTAKTALREHINQTLLDKAVSPSTGDVTKAALNRWLKVHRPALKKLGMTSEFDSLVKARAAVDKALASSKEFEKSAASRVLNADVNDVVKQAFSKGSKKEAAEDLIAFMKKPKPSRDELLYHATDMTVPPGESLIDGYFGGKYHLENEMLEPYGSNLYAIKPPKGTKILDISDGSEDAWKFMEEYMEKADPIPVLKDVGMRHLSYKDTIKAIKNRDSGSNGAFEAFQTYYMDTWTIPQKLKLTKEMGYDILHFGDFDEYLVPESLIKKSQAFDALTHEPVTGKMKPVKTADMYVSRGKLKGSNFDDWVVKQERFGEYIDPKALAGLQNAMVDEILTEIPLEGNVSELLTSSKMAAQLRKYDAALKVVFKDSPEKLKAMHTVRRAVKALEYKTGKSAGEGEKYATNVVTKIAFIYGHSTAAVADIAKKTANVFRGMSKEKIHKYINRGILDPEVAFSLVSVSHGGLRKKAVQGITNSLIRLGLIAQPKEERRK
jgi:hypothetical protein